MTKKSMLGLELEQLPVRIRDDIEQWTSLLKSLLEKRPLSPYLRISAIHQKVSVATVHRKLRAYEKYGWRALINRAKFPFPLNALVPPHEFRAFLYRMWIANKENYRATHEQVTAMWKGGARIPGYPERPKKGPFTAYPQGWTYENFIYHIKALKKESGENAEAGTLSVPAPLASEIKA